MEGLIELFQTWRSKYIRCGIPRIFEKVYNKVITGLVKEKVEMKSLNGLKK